jgi:hypothetical protein
MVTEERKFLQEMMVHETAQSTGAAAYLINRFWLLHVLSTTSPLAILLPFILNCFHILLLPRQCVQHEKVVEEEEEAIFFILCCCIFNAKKAKMSQFRKKRERR